MHNIIAYNKNDFNIIKSWTKEWLDVIPPETIFCEDGTFILIIDDTPCLCITVLLTQSKDMAYIFNYIKNPLFKDISLDKYGQILWNHCFDYAKDKGYSRVLCFADNDKLSDKYQRYGMTATKNLLGLARVFDSEKKKD